jgi:hypothetical protein
MNVRSRALNIEIGALMLVLSPSLFCQTLVFSPTCGTPGTKVCVTGSGWAEPSPSCYYRFYFNNVVAAPDQPDGLYGPPARSITVPAVAPGSYPIKVDLRLYDNTLLQTKQSGDTYFDFSFPFVHTIPSFKVVAALADPWKPFPGGGSKIDIAFNPKDVCDVTPCTKLVFLQVRQPVGVKADGTTRALTFAEQGFKNPATLDADVINGRLVDYIVGENDPYYNGDDSGYDGGTQGVQNNTPVTATMDDTPKRSDSAYPADIVKIRLNFEVAVFCASGDDKGKYFGRMFWTWERAKGAVGVLGTTSGISADRQQPSAGFIAAVSKWNTNHGFTTKFPVATASPCP